MFYTDSQQLAAAAVRAVHRPELRRRASTRPLAANYNIGFLFASGRSGSRPGKTRALQPGAGLRRATSTSCAARCAPCSRSTTRTTSSRCRRRCRPLTRRGGRRLRAPVVGRRRRARRRPGDRRERLRGLPHLPLDRPRVPGPAGDHDRHAARADRQRAADRPVRPRSTACAASRSRPSKAWPTTWATTPASRHTWTDTTVDQRPGVLLRGRAPTTSGPDSLAFYPSENAITVSRTPARRGDPADERRCGPAGPEGASDSWPAETDSVAHVAGDGVGHGRVEVVNSNLVPDGHLFKLTFATASPDSIRASTYALTDSTHRDRCSSNGPRLRAAPGIGPVGRGLAAGHRHARSACPSTAASTGFRREPDEHAAQGHVPELALDQPAPDRLPGRPHDRLLRRSCVDTAIWRLPARTDGPRSSGSIARHRRRATDRLDFRFRDLRRGRRRSSHDPDEYYRHRQLPAGRPLTVPKLTWRVQLDTLGTGGAAAHAGRGDVYQSGSMQPFGADDVFVFRTRGQRSTRSRPSRRRR